MCLLLSQATQARAGPAGEEILCFLLAATGGVKCLCRRIRVRSEGGSSMRLVVVTVAAAAVLGMLVVCRVSAGSGNCKKPFDPCVNVTENQMKCYGNRLLLLAERGNLCRVEELLSQHIQEVAYYVEFTEEKGKRKGYNALLWAAEKNDTDLVSILVKEYDSIVNHQSFSGWSALLLLASHGNLECVELLLNNSADPNIRTKNGYTPIILAAWNRFPRIVQTLIEYKADPDAVSPKTRYSALYLAARNGDMEIAKNVVQGGGNINIQSSWGVTPLLVATYWGHLEVVKYLLSQGADPNVKQIDGYTAVHKAVYYNYPSIVNELFQHGGVDINIKSKSGHTPLMLAVRNSDVNMVTKLLDNGAKADIQDNKGYTALMLAVRNGLADLVTQLVDAGANVNQQDKTGRTAVHWAAGTRDVEVMKKLLKECPDLTIKDKTGKTALDMAKKEIIDLLEGHKVASC